MNMQQLRHHYSLAYGTKSSAHAVRLDIERAIDEVGKLINSERKTMFRYDDGSNVMNNYPFGEYRIEKGMEHKVFSEMWYMADVSDRGRMNVCLRDFDKCCEGSDFDGMEEAYIVAMVSRDRIVTTIRAMKELKAFMPIKERF